VQLLPYADADLPLTEALERDPEVMAELGGPMPRAEPRFERIHAFPGVANVPSNALCRRFGFAPLGEADITYAGRSLRCHHWALETSATASSTRSSAS
jgi:hypothetical protein